MRRAPEPLSWLGRENFLASAVQALLGETREFLVVENGEVVELTDSSGDLHARREPWSVSLRGGLGAEAVELGVYETS